MWRRLASWPTRGSWPASRSLRRSGAGTGLLCLGPHRVPRAGARRGRSVGGTRGGAVRHEQPADRAAGHPAARRVHKVARETVTLDLLSSRRLTLGAGLGGARNGELEPFGRSPIHASELGCSIKVWMIWSGTGPGIPASPGAAAEDPRVGGRPVAAPAAAGTTGAAVAGQFPGYVSREQGTSPLSAALPARARYDEQ
jgi:hypothetical protein